MPLESIICRKNLDEARGNLWICECPMCREARRSESDEGLFHGDGVGRTFRGESKNNLPETLGQGDSGLQGR